MCHSIYRTIINVFWVCYDHSMRENAKFITNFRLSLAPVNWNFVDGFLDMQQEPCSSRQQWFVAADNKLIKWPNAQPISYWGPLFY